MNIFAIGDLHLSFDERIQKPMDIFGPSWVNHHEKVRKNWEEKVGEEDLVIIPGDVSWGLRADEAMADLRWIHRLPGRKVITKGNHDLWWTSVTRLNRLYDDMTFLQNHCYMTAEGVAVCGTRGWICPGTEGFDEHDEKIYNRELLRLEFSLKEAEKAGAKMTIAALHYPPTNDKLQGSGFTRMLEDYNVQMCVYGHLHGKDAFKNGIKGVFNGIEYRLVSLDYVEGEPQLICCTDQLPR
ncbi:MAG: metallophosphoesterase [Anaerovoracaceae bacterium]